MNLTPFVRVDATAFSASRAEILRAWGAPARSCRNSVGLNELDYQSTVFRFQDCGRLEEITLEAPVVAFGVVVVPFSALEPFVLAHDSEAFERAGFIISPTFGLAFDPHCPSWVTALAEHCIDSWRAL